MAMVLWAIGAGLGYGAGLLFIPEALLNFRMGSIWWSLYAAIQALALLTIGTWCAGKAWRLYQARDD